MGVDKRCDSDAFPALECDGAEVGCRRVGLARFPLVCLGDGGDGVLCDGVDSSVDFCCSEGLSVWFVNMYSSHIEGGGGHHEVERCAGFSAGGVDDLTGEGPCVCARSEVESRRAGGGFCVGDVNFSTLCFCV